MQCNLDDGFYVQKLPKGIEERLKLPKATRVVILVNFDNEEWKVRYNWSDTNHLGSYGAGWKQFCIENNLHSGDICIFERVDKGNSNTVIKLRVHIFRVNLEGGMSDDGLAKPTSHSNKKMKVSREDLSTNLPAKRGRPRKEKQGAWELEDKERKTNSRRDHLKDAESNYVPSISASKCSHDRHSLRVSKRPNLVKLGKKGVLWLPSPFARDDVNREKEIISIDD